jgi:hypothetical protein
LIQASLLFVAVYFVLSAVIGARLVLRSWRTPGAPELLMGIAYLAAPGFGYPLVVGSSSISDPGTRALVFGLGQSGVVFGCSCFLLFITRTFRPKSLAAHGGAALGVAAFGWAGFHSVRYGASIADLAERQLMTRDPTLVVCVTLSLTYFWTIFEGLRYYRMMRKRMSIGIGDPVVANRFLLWALAAGTSLLSPAVTALYLEMGRNISTEPVPILATSGSGVINSCLLILIFLPPMSYTRWVARSAARGALATV